MLAAMLELIGASFVSKALLKKATALYDARIGGVIEAHADPDMRIAGQPYNVKCMLMGVLRITRNTRKGARLPGWLKVRVMANKQTQPDAEAAETEEIFGDDDTLLLGIF